MTPAAKRTARKTNAKKTAPKPKATKRAPTRKAAKPAPATIRAPESTPVSDHAAYLAPPAPKQGKRVHGKFSMPKADYALIDALKTSAKKAGRPVKKNELLRAGLRALASLDPVSLRLALAPVQPEKAAKAKKGAKKK